MRSDDLPAANRPLPDSAHLAPPGRRPWRVWLGRMVAVVSSLLLPLLVFEAILRMGGAVAPGEYQTVDLNEASDQFGRLNMANRAGWKRSSEFSVHVRVNSRGLRGDEIDYAKPDGVYRVLVIGDSFTFGGQVEEEETFVARLGDYLRAEARRAGIDSLEIETINGGVDGWNTYNELAWLQAEGVRYEPDQVVVMFYTGNDPGENYDWMKALKRSGVEPPSAWETRVRELRKSAAGYSAVYALIESGVVQKFAPVSDPSEADTAPLQTRRSSDPDRKDRGWEISGDLFRQLHEFCDESGIDLTVVSIPTLEHAMADDRPPTPFLALGEDAGADAIDLLGTFRDTPAAYRETLYFPKDKHWTPAGHDLAAERVADSILTRVPGRTR